MADWQLSIPFILPENDRYAKALGYAYGLNAGMLSPLFGGHLPPKSPIKARGPISTNDPERFCKLFKEGHEHGFLFGKQASLELAEALDSLPRQCWWMICIYFAGEQEGVVETDMQEDSPEIEQVVEGIQAFRRIHQRHYPPRQQ